MGHAVNNDKELFASQDFFAEGLDAFMIRFDYYCKPYFLQRFLAEADRLLIQLSDKTASHPFSSGLNFRVEIPNAFLIQKINPDSVAQNLNAPLESIFSDKVYIYEIGGLWANSKNGVSPAAELIIGNYYCCLYVEKYGVSISDMDLCIGLHDILKNLETEGLVALVNLEMKATGRMIADRESYLHGDCYGTYKKLDIQHNCSQLLAYSLDKGNEKYVVNNNFRFGDVIIDNTIMHNVWEQRITLTTDCSLEFENNRSFTDMFNLMLTNGIQFLEQCVK